MTEALLKALSTEQLLEYEVNVIDTYLTLYNSTMNKEIFDRMCEELIRINKELRIRTQKEKEPDRL